MTNAAHATWNDAINQLIAGLESLIDGDQAAQRLIALGPQAVPAIERFLVASRPRSISVARCRAVRILGELGAYSSLMNYFGACIHPSDATVLFAEDAVRSAAAHELMRHESPATLCVLLDAVELRATSGVVQALSEYRRPESVPLLFELLEDDLCREDAKEGLRKAPEEAKAYAILLLRGLTHLPVHGSNASRRRRATLQLLVEFGIGTDEWPDLRVFLGDEDRDCVISVATLGLRCVAASERPSIIAAVIEASAEMDWAQETEACELLDRWPDLARQVAREVCAQRESRGERTNWRSPFWRILHHVLDDKMDARQHGAA